MEFQKRNFLINPTGKEVLFVSILWLIGTGLLVLASTDLFTENMFQRRYLLTNFMILASTVSVAKFHYNYWKSKKTKNA